MGVHKKYGAQAYTRAHIVQVRYLLREAVENLFARMRQHDHSRYYDSEERKLWNQHTEPADRPPYATEEYWATFDDCREALAYHWQRNGHHIEHAGLQAMSLLDLLEMLADWKATGDAYEGRSDLQTWLMWHEDHYNLPPIIVDILHNTATELGWIGEKE